MSSFLFRHIFRFLPALLCLGVPVLPAAAQAPEPARFLLEAIVVEGVQRDAVREIVVGESLLKPGREYTEQELREAVYRVKRLPFVLDAELALRKGSERGAYELVITVEQTSVIFYSATAGGFYGKDFRPEDDPVDWGAYGTLGARWFVGSQGLVFGSVNAFEQTGVETAQVGYTRYNLFGRGGFASVGLATNVSEEAADGFLGSISLGLPIVGNHSIRADLSMQRLDFSQFAGASFERDSYSIGAAWIYDTTDDPLFPSTGTRVSGDVGYSRSEDTIDESLFGRSAAKVDSFQTGLSGRRHWALTPRQSVGAELGVGISRLSGYENIYAEFTRYDASGSLLHSMDLWGFEKTERIGDLRWENALRLNYDESEADFSTLDTTNLELVTSLAFRNTWGVTRLSFTYADNLDDRP